MFVSIPFGRLEYKVTLEHNEVDGFHLVASGTYEESRVPLLDEEWGWFYEMHHVWHRVVRPGRPPDPGRAERAWSRRNLPSAADHAPPPVPAVRSSRGSGSLLT